MITIGYVNQLQRCPPSIIKYKYIPRTFKQDQDNPANTSEIFRDMFESQAPWMGIGLS